MITTGEWSRAFAVQALADLDTHHLMRVPDVPECHRLQFLQMACEKLCKAHLCDAGSDPEVLQSSHAYIAKNLPIILQVTISAAPRDALRFRWVVDASRALAREIELLSPAVTDGGRRAANCEYPWIEGEELVIPAEYRFPNLSLVKDPTQVRAVLFKLIRTAIEKLV